MVKIYPQSSHISLLGGEHTHSHLHTHTLAQMNIAGGEVLNRP